MVLKTPCWCFLQQAALSFKIHQDQTNCHLALESILDQLQEKVRVKIGNGKQRAKKDTQSRGSGMKWAVSFKKQKGTGQLEQRFKKKNVSRVR